ncbi:MAG: purine-nucleoside phosphorylase [bacterium]
MNNDIIEEAVRAVRARVTCERPLAALILGSGWDAAAPPGAPLARLAYRDIPGLGAPEVAGHSGELTVQSVAGCSVLVFHGRRHFYEGAGWEPVAIPVAVARALGASVLLLTNSAGSLRADWRSGTLMAVRDHLNAMGDNPLIGAHNSFWGPRFPDMAQIYDAGLRRTLAAAAEEAGVALPGGVYAGVTGPSYETPAEVKALRTCGADVVGMSTVPEAILGHAAGLRVAAVSCVTNTAGGAEPSTHDAVLRAAKAAMDGAGRLVQVWLRNLAEEEEQLS